MKVINKMSVHFWTKLKRARIEAGLSQRELAKRAGIPPTTLGGADKGSHRLTAENLKKVAEALGVPMEKLVEDESKPSRRYLV
jgi:transcriptional regulator with XRE-family HTH domain